MANLLPRIVNSTAEKSGLPTIAAMKGVQIFTNAVTTASKAAPMTAARLAPS